MELVTLTDKYKSAGFTYAYMARYCQEVFDIKKLLKKEL